MRPFWIDSARRENTLDNESGEDLVGDGLGLDLSISLRDIGTHVLQQFITPADMIPIIGSEGLRLTASSCRNIYPPTAIIPSKGSQAPGGGTCSRICSLPCAQSSSRYVASNMHLKDRGETCPRARDSLVTPSYWFRIASTSRLLALPDQ
jgi:hypothetical protein